MRVVIADDEVLLREGLARLLTEAGIQVLGLVGDRPSLERAVALEGPMSPSSTSRCHPRTPTKGWWPPPRSDNSIRRSACCCSRTTWILGTRLAY